MEDYPLQRGADGVDTITVPYTGARLLAHNMFNRGTAFSHEERKRLGLRGLLPNRIRTLDEQAVRAYEHVCEHGDVPIELYLSLADLESRNATLYYRVLCDHLEQFLPVVYTPTVGEACQRYSYLYRRWRGLWITPEHQGSIVQTLRNAAFSDVRLICVTDNERILGLGDQGAGGMGIPVGKLDLYTVGAGIHPTQTLPISLDVGTDRSELRDDPSYIGWRGERLRGERYDALVEELVEAVKEVFPNALLQWEDFKKANAFRLLDRYAERLLSFNDDIQGTAGVALAGVVAASRISGVPMKDQRVLIVGAGAAGIGIARILRAELESHGLEGDRLVEAIAVLDSQGLLAESRPSGEPHKNDFLWPDALVEKAGLEPGGGDDLLETVKALSPTVLIGTSGQAGTFTEQVVRAMAERCERPAIFPFSNPNSKAEAHPDDIVRWSEGRALIASGSPFDAVEYEGRTIDVAQGNNVYVFPGVGLGALAVGATRVVDSMFTAAAHAIAGLLDDEEIERSQLYPRLSALRSISRAVASAVARDAIAAGVAAPLEDAEIEARIDRLVWDPEYPTIVLPPVTPAE